MLNSTQGRDCNLFYGKQNKTSEKRFPVARAFQAAFFLQCWKAVPASASEHRRSLAGSGCDRAIGFGGLQQGRRWTGVQAEGSNSRQRFRRLRSMIVLFH